MKRLNTTFKTLFLSTVLLFSIALNAQESGPESIKSPRFIVHLLDYLAKDYAGAVSEGGKVLSDFEYAEQVEFAQSVVNTAKELPELNSNSQMMGQLTELLAFIKAKQPPAKVTPLARKLQSEVVTATKIDLFPVQWPVMRTGETIYRQSCAVCHGNTGAGDGPGGKGLDPAPANFVDPEGMKALSPFAAYNTIRLGVPGTGMPPFPQLSDQEVWALSFYVNSLRHLSNATGEPPAEWSVDNQETLKKVAGSTDPNLISLLPGSDADKIAVLARLRTHTGKDDQSIFLNVAKAKLAEASSLYKSGQFDLARGSALQAYLEGIEPIEAKLRASDPDMIISLEEKMGLVRNTIESKKTQEELDNAIASVNLEIGNAQKLLVQQEMSPWMAFASAFAILLREGFEAVLIILALLGVIRASGSKKAAIWVHGGWIAAVGLGFVAWTFSGWVMKLSGAGRELLEGVVSLLAVFVLIYVGFWLHRQTEIGRWKHFLEVKVKGFLSGGKLIGLASISFVAVFREAFETVLFLRAIWMDLGPDSKTALGFGVFSALAIVFILSWIALNMSRKLPLKSLFNFSALMMLGLATVLAGKGIHSLQEAGHVSVTAFLFKIRSELFGVYPTTETIIAQVVIFVMVITVWRLSSRSTAKID